MATSADVEGPAARHSPRGMRLPKRARTRVQKSSSVATMSAARTPITSRSGRKFSAIGAPGRPVLALEGDGSAMYTLQALWTMARESLPVVVLVFANRAYTILQGELKGVGAQISGDKARDMLSLDRPPLDWVALARGHGVPGVRVEDVAALVAALRRGFASGGPCLVEVAL